MRMTIDCVVPDHSVSGSDGHSNPEPTSSLALKKTVPLNSLLPTLHSCRFLERQRKPGTVLAEASLKGQLVPGWAMSMHPRWHAKAHSKDSERCLPGIPSALTCSVEAAPRSQEWCSEFRHQSGSQQGTPQQSVDILNRSGMVTHQCASSFILCCSERCNQSHPCAGWVWHAATSCSSQTTGGKSQWPAPELRQRRETCRFCRHCNQSRKVVPCPAWTDAFAVARNSIATQWVPNCNVWPARALKP